MVSQIGFLRDSLAKVTHLPAYDYLSLELCKKLLRCVGFWPAHSEPQRIAAAVRQCLPPFLLLMNLYSGIIGYPMLVYHTYGVDLQRCLLAAASEFVIFSLSVIYSSLLFRRDQIDSMFRAMEAMNVCRAELAERPSDVVEGNTRLALVPLGYMLLCLAMIAGGFLDIPGAYAMRGFQFEQWYPFDEKVFPTYQIVFVLTTISYNCALVCMGSFTAMFMSLVVEAIGHFRLLSHNFRTIVEAGKGWTLESSDGSHSLQDEEQPNANLPVVSVPAVQLLADDLRSREQPASNPGPNTGPIEDRTVQEDNSRSSRVSTVQPQEKIGEVLKSCLHHHYAIIRFVDEIVTFFERFLSRFLMTILVPNSMAIVLLIYATQFDKTTETVLFVAIGGNLGMVIMCWLADCMTEESEGVRDAVYDCDWFGQSESFKRSMRIIMSRCNQPVVVKVGGFITLSMVTFFEMAKLTYSYSMAVWTEYQEVVKE